MITIFSSTNRPNSNTEIIARYYAEVFRSKTEEEINLFPLTELPIDLFNTGMYSSEGQSASLGEIQNRLLIPANKLFFVIPEYNGGIPGVLKLMIDAFSIRQYKPSFKGKKAALAGIASGRAGNLRGMDQFTHILNHVGVSVMPNKLPISSVESIVNEEQLIDENTIRAIRVHAEEFLAF